jgi:hypothetical protein
MPVSKIHAPGMVAFETLLLKLRKAEEDGDEEAVDALKLAVEFGREPREGHTLARTIFGDVFEEQDGTPFGCSPRSENYWCS